MINQLNTFEEKCFFEIQNASYSTMENQTFFQVLHLSIKTLSLLN